MKMCNGLFIALICFLPTISVATKNKKPQYIKHRTKQPAGPISNPSPNRYRSVVTCPVCPNFTCTGITGITGCTGPGCTGPCTPDITSFFCCLNISQSETIRGSLIADTEFIEGSLGVSGSANFRGELIVQGNGNLQQDVCIGGNLNVGGNASVGGFEVVLGTLRVNNGVTINGNLVETGNEILNGNLFVTGNSTIDQNLVVGGSATFAGLLTANGGSTGLTGPSLNVFNGSIVNNGLIILNTGCTAPTGCTGAFIGGNVCIIGDELVTGDFDVNGELTVDKNALFNGEFTSTGTLITNNTVTMNDGLTIASGDQIINAGNLNLINQAGILQVDGLTTFQGTVAANAGALISDGITVEEGNTLSVGDFSVPQGSVSVEGSVTAGGTITSSAGQSQFGSALINSTENALCATGPAALTIAGGAGIGKNLWLGECQFFSNVETDVETEVHGIPGCLNYYEETCFSTAFTWGGQPVTPATNILIQLIRVGNIVNIIIPEIILNNPGAHIDVISSSTPLPARFRPMTSIRGAASTVITNNPSGVFPEVPVVGQLGEFNVSPSGTITIGLSGDAISPQRIFSTDYVYADINTITYNVDGCAHTCKRCAG